MMSLAIEACYLQGIGGNINCIEIWQTRFLYRNGNRNSTATSPNVSNHWHMSISNAAFNNLKTSLNEQFSLWTGNKHPFIHKKVQTIKLFMPSEISHWLMLLPTCDQCKILFFLL